MDNISKYICKSCSQTDFIEWQTHRTAPNTQSVHQVDTKPICLTCLLEDQPDNLPLSLNWSDLLDQV